MYAIRSYYANRVEIGLDHSFGGRGLFSLGNDRNTGIVHQGLDESTRRVNRFGKGGQAAPFQFGYFLVLSGNNA